MYLKTIKIALRTFGFVPQGGHLLQRQLGDLPPPDRRALFHGAETMDEFFAGAVDCVLGVASAEAAHLHGGEQYVAQLVRHIATNVRGAPVSTLYCYGLIVVLNLIAIARCVPERPSYLRLFARPVLITAVMALAARSSYGLLARSLPERWAVLPAIAVAVVVYGVLVLALGAVTRQDVLDLPKGEKIARMLHLH